MLFSSCVFLLLFLPCVILLNSLVKKEHSNYLLLAASLFFYAWGEPFYVLLMLLSIVVNWSFGMAIDKANTHRSLLLAVCVAINLSLLGYYKYFNFFVDILNGLFRTEVFRIQAISLPIGISFFTFQALSYVIDLYRGNCKPQKNILNLALYISFFPQLIAGPIVRYADIDAQIRERTTSLEKFALGLRRFLYGLGKKVIISNCMAEVADIIWGIAFPELTTLNAWIGAIAYSLQIYYDFSGYSDMAIGLGQIFGFHFLENFRYPYLSRSIQEFWQRWHISLGTWFKEYVYIPLGGNRRGTVKTYINLVVVFFLTGLWHGANWTFLFWGLYHGAFQILERLGLKKFLKKHVLFSHCYSLLVVIFGWVFFRSDSLMDSLRFILRMIAPWHYGIERMLHLPTALTTYSGLLMILAIAGSGIIQALGNRVTTLRERWKHSYTELIFLCLVFIYSIIRLAAGTYNPFIYFRF